MYLKLNKFISINNILPELGLDSKYLTVADNVYQNSDMTIATSQGFTKVKDIQNAHSLWADYDVCLLRAEDKLYRVIDNFELQLLIEGLLGSEQMKYLRIGNKVFMMDGLNALVYDGWKVFPYVLDIPPQPSIEAIDGGTLKNGKYRVRISWLREDDIETPLSDYDEVLLEDNKGIRIHIPNCGNPNYKKLMLYITDRDSGNFYLYQDFLINTTTVDILDFTITRIKPATEEIVSMPIGRNIAMFNSRLFCSEANILYFSEVFDYFHRKALNFLAIPEYIEDLVGLKEHLFVITSEAVYSINRNFELKKIYNEPLIRNTIQAIDLSSLIFIENRMVGIGLIGMSNKGVVVITEDGNAFSITESYYQPNDTEYKSSLVFKNNYYIIPE